METTAPPPITNLDVVEIDTRHPTEMIHLRWKSPLPPTNGKLRHYVIQICNIFYCQRLEVDVNNTCDLWDDHICAAIIFTNSRIQVKK